jgi:hypothetical protein
MNPLSRLRLAVSGLALPILAFAASAASAHEARPAYLELTEQPDHTYEALWKQPRRGQMAVRLVPHLSNGWLESSPTVIDANPAFAIKTWRGLGPGSLEGVTVSVEGLENTLSGALIRVTLADGSKSKWNLASQGAPITLSLKAPSAPASETFLAGLRSVFSGPRPAVEAFLVAWFAAGRGRRRADPNASVGKEAAVWAVFFAAQAIGAWLIASGRIHFPGSLAPALAASGLVLFASASARAGEDRFVADRAPWFSAVLFGLSLGASLATGLPGGESAVLDLTLTGCSIAQLPFFFGAAGLSRLAARISGPSAPAAVPAPSAASAEPASRIASILEAIANRPRLAGWAVHAPIFGAGILAASGLFRYVTHLLL